MGGGAGAEVREGVGQEPVEEGGEHLRNGRERTAGKTTGLGAGMGLDEEWVKMCCGGKEMKV